jgi:hypothetical protein
MPSDRGMGLRLIATETDCTVGAGDEVASERLRTYLRRLDVDSFCAADGPLAVRPGATSGRLPKRLRRRLGLIGLGSSRSPRLFPRWTTA